MTPRHLLRIEGLAALLGSLGVYFTLDGPLWMLVLLALAPDLAMLGYLAGPRVGSRVYNLFHTYTLPLGLGAIGYWGGARVAILVAAIWAGHIGADRLFGYGLKLPTGFADTHLSSRPRPIEGE